MPGTFARGCLRVIESIATASSRLGLPSEAYWVELRNKLSAFRSFTDANAKLWQRCVSAESLLEFVEEACASNAQERIWKLEGFGYAYGSTLNDKSDRSLLGDRTTCNLPPSSLIPLHAGLGLASARHFFETLQDCSSMPQALRTFSSNCNFHGRKGYCGIVHEYLGFVARTLYPGMMKDIDTALATIDEELVEYFWHGVGRAHYFEASYLRPRKNLHRHMVKDLERQCPHAIAQRNGLAGLAFAVALVNSRTPEILSGFIKRCSTTREQEDAFSSGVNTASLVALEVMGWEHMEQSFAAQCGRQSNETRPKACPTWDRLVVDPRAGTHYADAKGRVSPEAFFRHAARVACQVSYEPTK